MRNKRILSNSEGGMVYSPKGVSQTITAGTHGYGMGNILLIGGRKMKVRSGQFRPKDRDYNKHGKKREVQFEMRRDGYSNALLANPVKNCILIEVMHNEKSV